MSEAHLFENARKIRCFFFQDFPPSKRFTVVMFWRSDVSRPFFACDKWLENFFFRLEKCRCTKDHTKDQVFVVCFLQPKNYFFAVFFTQVVYYTDVSKNRGGPPKWMVKIMENPMNKLMIWGVFPIFLETPIYGLLNLHHKKLYRKGSLPLPLPSHKAIQPRYHSP